MKKIVMSHNFPLDQFEEELKDFEIICPVKRLDMYTKEEAVKAIKEATAFVCLKDFVCDKELIDAGKNLKTICNLGSGFDNVDVAYATEKGIVVLNTPNSVMEPTAEMTIALVLGICRSTVRYDRELRKSRFCKSELLLERDMMVSGKTMGILGFGRIGRCVAKKANALGMKILYYDKFQAPEDVEKSLDASFVSTEYLLANSDVISLHLPYVPENYRYMDESKISQMKKNAYLINASRGAIVSEKALIEALKNQTIAGAALDVHEYEPDISEEIVNLENIVITPHICTNIAEVRMNMMGELIGGIQLLLNDKIPGNVVNPKALQPMKN